MKYPIYDFFMYDMSIYKMSFYEMTQHHKTLAPMTVSFPNFLYKPPQYSIETDTCKSERLSC